MSTDPLSDRVVRQLLRNANDEGSALPRREPWHRWDGWILALLAAAAVAVFVSAGFVLCRVFAC